MALFVGAALLGVSAPPGAPSAAATTESETSAAFSARSDEPPVSPDPRAPSSLFSGEPGFSPELAAATNTAALVDDASTLLRPDGEIGIAAFQIAAAVAPPATPPPEIPVTLFTRFIPLDIPVRVIDTRDRFRGGASTVDLAPLAGGRSKTINVTGLAGIPNGVGLAMNVTITQPSAAAFVTVYPSGLALPLASNLNVAAGQTTSNLVVSAIRNQSVDVYLSNGQAEVIIDVFGYFETEFKTSGLVEAPPFRIADTRLTRALEPGEARTLITANRRSTRAALLNVTVTGSDGPTWIAAVPGGRPWGGTSNVNVATGETRANLVLAPIGPDRSISFLNGPSRTNVIVDVIATFDDELAGDGGTMHLQKPQRLVDTRSSVRNDGSISPIGPGQAIFVDLNGTVPRGTAYVLVNLTSTDATSVTYLTAGASGRPLPPISNLNPRPRSIVPNMALVPVGDDGRIVIANFAGSVHVIVDMIGWASDVTGIGAPARATLRQGPDSLVAEWTPPISPRDLVVSAYEVQLISPRGARYVEVPSTVTSATFDTTLVVGDQVEVHVRTIVRPQAGLRLVSPYAAVATHTVTNQLWAPTDLKVLPGPTGPQRVPMIVWSPVTTAASYEVAVLDGSGRWRSRLVAAESVTEPQSGRYSLWSALPDLAPASISRVAVRALGESPGGVVAGPWSPSILVEAAPPVINSTVATDVGLATKRVYGRDVQTGDAVVFDHRTGERLLRFPTLRRPLGPVVTPDETAMLVLSDTEQSLAVYDPATGQRRFRVPLPRAFARSVHAIDNRYAIADMNDGTGLRIDVRTGATTVVEFRRSNGELLVTNSPLRLPAQDRSTALLGNERFRFVDGVPVAVGSAPFASDWMFPSANGAAWVHAPFRETCTVMDGGFAVVRTYVADYTTACAPVLSEDGKHLFRRTGLFSPSGGTLQRIDIATDMPVASFPDATGTMIVDGRLVGSDSTTFAITDVRMARPTPPDVAPPASLRPLATAQVPRVEPQFQVAQEGDRWRVGGAQAPGATRRAELVPMDGGPITLRAVSADGYFAAPPQGMSVVVVVWDEWPGGVQRMSTIASVTGGLARERFVLVDGSASATEATLKVDSANAWPTSDYRVRATPVGGGTAIVADVTAYTASSPASVKVSGLTPDTSYSVTVETQSDGAASRSAPMILRTAPVTIAWAPVANPDPYTPETATQAAIDDAAGIAYLVTPLGRVHVFDLTARRFLSVIEVGERAARIDLSADASTLAVAAGSKVALVSTATRSTRWIDNEWGSDVIDVVQLYDGTLLVSLDGGRLYRVSRVGSATPAWTAVDAPGGELVVSRDRRSVLTVGPVRYDAVTGTTVLAPDAAVRVLPHAFEAAPGGGWWLAGRVVLDQDLRVLRWLADRPAPVITPPLGVGSPDVAVASDGYGLVRWSNPQLLARSPIELFYGPLAVVDAGTTVLARAPEGVVLIPVDVPIHGWERFPTAP